jgi:putative heme-binding domain-containing protein
VISNREEVLEIFSANELWNSPLVKKHILERLAQRFASEEDFTGCARLLEAAGDRTDDVDTLLKGIDKAFAGRSFDSVAPSLASWFERRWNAGKQSSTLIRVGVRLGSVEAQNETMRRIKDEKLSAEQRAEFVELLGETRKAMWTPSFLTLLENSRSEKIQAAAIAALARLADVETAKSLLKLYPKLNGSSQREIRNALANRAGWAPLLLSAIESGAIGAKEIPIEQVRKMASLNVLELQPRIQKLWGRIQTESPEEMRSTINRLKLVLKPSGAAGREAKGNPAEGKKIFQQTCAVCHKLFGEGNTIGPELTGVDRKNTEFLLANIVDPSAYIRAEFSSFELETKDGESLSGLITESNASAVTLLDRNNQRHTISREQIKELKESQTSLMPDGLLEALEPQQLLDLFSYLQKD